MIAKVFAAESVETTVDALLVGHRGKIIDESTPDFKRDYSIVLPDNWIDRVIPQALVAVDHRLVPIPGAVTEVRSVEDAGASRGGRER